jgi:mannosyltransferase
MALRRMNGHPAASEPVATPVERRGLVRWGVVGLVLLSFLLRVYNLGAQEFWFDEALTAYVSGLGWEDTIAYLRSAPFEHPPLYFLSLYPWQVLTGTSEFAFRFYSVFWGVLLVALVYVLVRRLADERLALLSALFATLSPFIISYSQEARMYTLLPCVAALALLSFWNAMEREDRSGWWLAYLVLLLVGVAVHYFFVLIWFSTAVYVLLSMLHQRRFRWKGLVIHALLPLVVVVWAVLAPGLRESMLRVGQGEMVFGLAYRLNKLLPPLLVSEFEGEQSARLAYLLSLGGWALVLIGVWWSRRSSVLKPRAWLLLSLLLVISLVGSLLVPYGVLGRHLGFILISAFTFMAAALLALRRWGILPLAVGSLLLLALTAYGLGLHYTSSNGHFGQAMAYINARGQPGDAVILSQPLQWPLEAYYNDGEWPVTYLPSEQAPPTPAEVEKTMGTLSRAHDRLWLGPVSAWTADPDRLAERWLSTFAFNAGKVWFPDSTSVSLHLTSRGELEPVEIKPVTWGGQIELQDLATGELRVHPGEAVRLRSHWKPAADLEKEYMLDLLLADEEGLVWVERQGEPCGGWCPTDEWLAGGSQMDQSALVIPPGTPPGTYDLQAAWIPSDGGLPLEAKENDILVQRVSLLKVSVLATDQPEEPWDLPHPQQVTFGEEITLLGYEPDTVQVRAGESLLLETHWRAETTSSADYVLRVELVDEEGQVAASWSSMPSVDAYPTSQWRPGEYLRGQLPFILPGSLASGRYRLKIGLAAPDGRLLVPGVNVSPPARLSGAQLEIAAVEVLDRPRGFDLPDVSFPLEATVGRKAHLIGYDLDLSQAHPNGQLRLTLYWQAGGPMIMPFKVFTHLVDADNNVLAQHDAFPGGGCCPANTWAEGEVIIDRHSIDLGADLAPGTYQLVAGMYDEESWNRVPAYDGLGNQLPSDQVLIRPVTVQAMPGSIEATSTGDGVEATTTPAGRTQVRPEDLKYRMFLPFVSRSKPWYSPPE